MKQFHWRNTFGYIIYKTVAIFTRPRCVTAHPFVSLFFCEWYFRASMIVSGLCYIAILKHVCQMLIVTMQKWIVVYLWNKRYLNLESWISNLVATFQLLIHLFRKSHNAQIPYITMCHSETEICTRVHISVTKWCIVGLCLVHYGMGLQKRYS